MSVPPNKKHLLAIDLSMVDSGTLNEGVPCVPVRLNRFQDGVHVEIEAHSRKFHWSTFDCLCLVKDL